MNLDAQKRIFISLSFLLAMIFFYGASTPVLAAEPTVIEVKDKTEFEAAIAQVNDNPGSEYTIKLTDDIPIGELPFRRPVRLSFWATDIR